MPALRPGSWRLPSRIAPGVGGDIEFPGIKGNVSLDATHVCAGRYTEPLRHWSRITLIACYAKTTLRRAAAGPTIEVSPIRSAVVGASTPPAGRNALTRLASLRQLLLV